MLLIYKFWYKIINYKIINYSHCVHDIQVQVTFS